MLTFLVHLLGFVPALQGVVTVMRPLNNFLEPQAKMFFLCHFSKAGVVVSCRQWDVLKSLRSSGSPILER